MAKVVLIDPATPTQLVLRKSTDRFRRWRYTPHLGLQVLAGASEGHDVTILDERVQDVDMARVDADLVGITVRTGLAPRAHQLARHFSSRGIPVVFGGPYPTLSPDLALADPAVASVFSGRAENLWRDLLADASRGQLKRHYTGKPAKGIPRPRRDLPVGAYRPAFALTQVTQGCNFRCKFCVIPALHDKEYVVPEVTRALEEIGSIPEKNLFLIDDNLIGNLPFARKLFEGLKGMGKRWICQCTLNVALDPEMLELMRDAGCRMINMGLETVNPTTWKDQNKKQNTVFRFEEAIKRIHDHGMLVSGGFIFGFDQDDESVFDSTLDFMWKSKIDFAACHVLTPYPGTPGYAQMKAEGRILTDDLGKYTTYDVVYQPTKMSPEVLQAGFKRVVNEFWSWKGLVRRLWSSSTEVDVLSGIGSAFTSFVTHDNLTRGLPTHA